MQIACLVGIGLSHSLLLNEYCHFSVNGIYCNPIKGDKQYMLCHLLIEKNEPVLHICEWQKYVNLCFLLFFFFL